ncbi:MAG: acetoacetyl-CoA synthetase [Actinomycetota bacterium]|nr:acetoacetyl-CoA synthetase [Actinomycetota bacterium]
MTPPGSAASAARPLWVSAADGRPRIREFMDYVDERFGTAHADYDALWSWSVEHIEDFWAALWDFFDVQATGSYERVLTTLAMPEARWFVGTRLNFARHALRHGGDQPAIIEETESRPRREISWDELTDQVGAAAAGFRRAGIVEGDRVVGYLPNCVEAVVAFLAAASIGAIWSSCPPEFGADAALSRFSQIAPRALLFVDRYRYSGQIIDRAAEVEAIRAGMPMVELEVRVPFYEAEGSEDIAGTVTWAELLAEPRTVSFVDVPFDHPLYILYSSGTTGIPKAIIHGHGGMLLEHLKMLGLHLDIQAGDRFFWFTTTGWMMWNYLVSGLLVGATVVLFDGNPVGADPYVLWEMASRLELTHFGVSATYLMHCRKQGLTPGALFDLSRIRHLGSTASPLPPEGSEWVYDAVGKSLVLGSASGGSDICSAFVGASPITPVYAGEISCRCLAADVHAFDEHGRSVVGERGELVVTKPLPCMPVGLWGDIDGRRLAETYFSYFPGVWRHGDWIELTDRGTCIISGRSDATLNRGGVRMGTAEFYTVVEDHPAVLDSLVVHIDIVDGRSGGSLVLLVVLVPDVALDEDLRRQLASSLRSRLSPRHVPDAVVQVPSIPKTVTGKKLEVPVKRYLQGGRLDEVADAGALADPAGWQELAEVLRGLRDELSPALTHGSSSAEGERS